MSKYFSYDAIDVNLYIHDTADEAKQSALDIAEDGYNLSSGWCDGLSKGSQDLIKSICYGVILGRIDLPVRQPSVERDGTNEDGSLIIHEVYGLRHYDPLMRKQIKELEKQYKYALLDYEQGFITNKGRFVTRDEALKIAKEQGQMIRLSGSPNPNILFSEDLY